MLCPLSDKIDGLPRDPRCTLATLWSLSDLLSSAPAPAHPSLCAPGLWVAPLVLHVGPLPSPGPPTSSLNEPVPWGPPQHEWQSLWLLDGDSGPGPAPSAQPASPAGGRPDVHVHSVRPSLARPAQKQSECFPVIPPNRLGLRTSPRVQHHSGGHLPSHPVCPSLCPLLFPLLTPAPFQTAGLAVGALESRRFPSVASTTKVTPLSQVSFQFLFYSFSPNQDHTTIHNSDFCLFH